MLVIPEKTKIGTPVRPGSIFRNPGPAIRVQPGSIFKNPGPAGAGSIFGDPNPAMSSLGPYSGRGSGPGLNRPVCAQLPRASEERHQAISALFEMSASPCANMSS